MNTRTGELYDPRTAYGQLRAEAAKAAGDPVVPVSPEAFDKLKTMTPDERVELYRSRVDDHEAARQAKLDRWAKSSEGRRTIRRQAKKFGRRTGVEQLTGREPERNAPCVCGSRRKYKACCKAKWDAGRGITSPAYTRLVGWSLERQPV